MKQIPIEKFKENLSLLLELAPRDRVLLTRNGMPFAFITGASQYDWEDIGYMTDPAFWKMIAERRKEKGGVPLEQLKAELAEREARSPEGPARRKARKNSKKSAA